MIEIEKPRIECIETPEDPSYGKYVIEPLERGYGTTLGNSLRRVLLSFIINLSVMATREAEQSYSTPFNAISRSSASKIMFLFSSSFFNLVMIYTSFL